MRVLRNYLLLVLFTVGPLFGALVAEWIAKANGCRIGEDGSHPCYIHGVDVGIPLSILFTGGWFALLTIPVGGIGILVYTGLLLARAFSRKKQ